MIDVTTKKPLKVSTEDPARPYLMLPVSQLDEIRRLLDSHGIRYSVDELMISWEGGPEEATIALGSGADARAVQAILDRVG